MATPDAVEDGEAREDEDSPIATIMAALTVALTVLAIRYRDGKLTSMTTAAAERVVEAHIEAHLVGQDEFSAADAQKAATVAARRVYGDGAGMARIASWATDIRPDTTDRAIAQRAAAHAGNVWASYQEGRADGAVASAGGSGPAAISAVGGQAVATWRRDRIDTSCTDCLALDGRSWPAEEIPQWPGDGGTACRSNCRCQLELSIVPMEVAA